MRRLLLCLLFVSVYAAAELPFAVKNEAKQKYPPEMATRIFWEATASVQLEIHMRGRADYHPDVTLVLGADEEGVETKNFKSTINLKKWDAGKFAQGCVMAATDQLMDQKRMMELARISVLHAQAMVSVKELEAEK